MTQNNNFAYHILLGKKKALVSSTNQPMHAGSRRIGVKTQTAKPGVDYRPHLRARVLYLV